MILNESLSFGVLGATGRGLMEMCGVDVGDVEIVALSMAHSLASVGGLCIGTTQVLFCSCVAAALSVAYSCVCFLCRRIYSRLCACIYVCYVCVFLLGCFFSLRLGTGCLLHVLYMATGASGQPMQILSERDRTYVH